MYLKFGINKYKPKKFKFLQERSTQINANLNCYEFIVHYKNKNEWASKRLIKFIVCEN
jgi:hypothetical protein